MFNIIYLPEVDSTIDYAMRNLDTLKDRDVILAETQTHGYGRFSRVWLSHVPGNIYMSLILKNGFEKSSGTYTAAITQFMSVIISNVLDTYSITAELKWPNDVLVNGKKIAGLLSQGIIKNGSVRGCIIGAGINLNMNPEDLDGIDQPAVSMKIISGKPVDRDLFLDSLLEMFFSRYDAFAAQGFSAIRESYTKKSTFLGKKVRALLPGSEITGTASGFSENGSLVIRDENGKNTRIDAGDIRLLS